MPTFKPGDKVKCIEPVAVLEEGEIYTVDYEEHIEGFLPAVVLKEWAGRWRASRFIKV